MKKFIALAAFIFIGLMTIMTSLVIAIPLTIAAMIAGKKIQRQVKANNSQAGSNPNSVIEGEYEDLSAH